MGLLILGVVVVGSGVLVLAAIRPHSTSEQLQTRAGAGAASQAQAGSRHANASQATMTVNIPEGYGRPVALTADPASPGVWFLAANDTSESVFFWNPAANKLSNYPFGQGANELQFGLQAGLTVDPTGTVWAGVGTTLVRLEPSDGAVSRIPLPSVATAPGLPANVASAGPGQPPALGSSHVVDTMAAERNGDIAIGLSFSNTVLLYSPGTGVFTSIALPGGDLPNSINALANGSLVVGALNTHAVDLVEADGSVVRNPIGTDDIACNATVCVGSSGNQNLYTFTPGPSVSQWSVSETAINSAKLLVGAAPTPSSDGTMIVPTTTGFEIVSPNGAPRAYTLPRSDCSTQGISVASRVPPSYVPCQEVAENYVVDSAGNIWFTSNSGNTAVYELAAGTY